MAELDSTNIVFGEVQFTTPGALNHIPRTILPVDSKRNHMDLGFRL